MIWVKTPYTRSELVAFHEDSRYSLKRRDTDDYALHINHVKVASGTLAWCKAEAQRRANEPHSKD